MVPAFHTLIFISLILNNGCYSRENKYGCTLNIAPCKFIALNLFGLIFFMLLTPFLDCFPYKLIKAIAISFTLLCKD